MSGSWRVLYDSELSSFASSIGDKLFNVRVLVGKEQRSVKAGRMKKHYQLARDVVSSEPVVGDDRLFMSTDCRQKPDT